MREVAVLGVGQTKFGELWDRSFREIGIEAGLQSLVDAKLSSGELGGLFLGNMASGSLLEQEHIAPLILDYAGLAGRHLPAIRAEGGGASGALAFHQYSTGPTPPERFATSSLGTPCVAPPPSIASP